MDYEEVVEEIMVGPDQDLPYSSSIDFSSSLLIGFSNVDDVVEDEVCWVDNHQTDSYLFYDIFFFSSTTLSTLEKDFFNSHHFHLSRVFTYTSASWVPSSKSNVFVIDVCRKENVDFTVEG